MNICGTCGTDIVAGDCGCNMEGTLRRRVAALEAKLAEVTAERDTLRAEVARLRAAIEPTAANVQDIIEAARKVPRDHPLATCSTGYILAAINARAGEVSAPVYHGLCCSKCGAMNTCDCNTQVEVSAPGSSLRERVEAACRAVDEQAKAWPGLARDGVRLATHTLRAALGEP